MIFLTSETVIVFKVSGLSKIRVLVRMSNLCSVLKENSFWPWIFIIFGSCLTEGIGRSFPFRFRASGS